jgi:16S rRNA (uracil1498-N3)-methyltransferase
MTPADNSHVFAFYTELVSTLLSSAQQNVYPLHDPELVHRLAVVVRMQKGDTLVLFDTQSHIIARIVSFEGRKVVLVEVLEIHKNRELHPEIQWVLPLLKREAFETALYTLTEMGATSIQPVITQKTARLWGGEKEAMRSKKIMIAAAEQSKQFALPTLYPIIPFELWLLKNYGPTTAKIFFDPLGSSLREELLHLDREKNPEIIALAGPEGDLTTEEKKRLIDQGFRLCALTPTILRAEQAVAVGLGALRSYLA